MTAASADPTYLLDVDGPAAPPRSNGELVFAAPWEARVFGMALALREAGAFSWDEFRARLIAEIAADRERAYYVSFAAALEGLLSAKGMVGAVELETRV